MSKGVVTFTMGERFTDQVLFKAKKLKIIKEHGYYSCTNDNDGTEELRLVCITGPWLVTKLLEGITQIRGKNLEKVVIDW